VTGAIREVSKSEFRKAQCCGRLAGCECLWGDNEEAWVKDGKTIAAHKTGILGSTYYLEA
jgi:hypothetical protein